MINYVDWLPLIVYLAIGIFFGELSLKVTIRESEHQDIVRVMTYIMAVLIWPIIVLMSIVMRGDR